MSNHDRRKNTLSKQDIARLSNKWVAQPSKQDGSIDRVRVCEGLNSFAAKHDSKIISPLHVLPLRLETPLDSDLPDRLRALGYTVTFKSEDLRIGGPARPEYVARWRQGVRSGAYGHYVVQVYDVDMPRSLPDPANKNSIPVR